MNKRNKKNEKGFALVYAAMLVLAVIVTAATSIAALTYNEQILSSDMLRSSQSYYAAEAGVEDAILRLKNDMELSSPYSFDVGTASVTSTVVVDGISGAMTITGEGNEIDRIRKVSAVYTMSSEEASFFYGAQIGDGGMEMGNGARVRGNVFSNGSVTGSGSARIDDSIVVAGNGNEIDGLEVDEDAKVYSCIDSEVGGDLIYVTGGTLDDCDVEGSISTQSEEIPSQNMPISQSSINQWKQDAEAGGVIGSYVLDSLQSDYLGPVKVNGNMTIQNLSYLTLTGTVWVTGDFYLRNLSLVRLDSDYGSNSGLIIVDGQVVIENGVWLWGSWGEDNYIMVLSTDDSLQENDPAIDINNVSAGDAIFYAGNGAVRLHNNVSAKEVAAYKLYLDNNTDIYYESGLQDVTFSSGPGASWQVTSWEEVE